MFDPVSYFKNLTNNLKLTKDKYHFSKVSGLAELEGLLSNRKYSQFHICVDINEYGTMVHGGGRGFFDRRPNTVFIAASVTDFNNMDEKALLVAEFRQIYHSFLTKLIKDKSQDSLFLLDLNRVPYYEMPGEFAGGCVGLYFFISVENQTDLRFVSSDWV